MRGQSAMNSLLRRFNRLRIDRAFFFPLLVLIFGSIEVVTAQSVKLSWDLSSNPYIYGYQIYRAIHQDSSFTLIGSVTHPDSIYIDNKMQRDVHYFYVATSVDKFGSESNFSNRIDTTIQTVVPVELYSFTARIDNQRDVRLDWSTVTESNNYGFEIQRFTGEHPEIETIAFIKGEGTTVDPRHYYYFDTDLPEGTYYYRLKQLDRDGSFEFSETIEVKITDEISTHLYQNYPNPFNTSTEIPYVLAESGHIELTIYNEIGRQVRRLVDQNQAKGRYYVRWDGKDSRGKEVGSGKYFYKIRTASFAEFKEMMLVK